MNAEKWQKVKRVFQIAVERENTAGRRACVAELCADDAELQSEVEKLLASDAQAENFIEKSFNDLTDEIYLAHQAHHVGQRIGAYKIIRQIATGGMGSVFLAERDDAEFSRQVAIKIIKPNMNHNFVQARFLQERQILASLDHPNIARLIDGGATDKGVPYLVMEYVEGLPIDKYCEAEALSLEERLHLFQAVCAAVHHAHQHLIIHRDLKPSNILVTPEGTPKLLDFGIAKLLAPVSTAPPATTLAFGLMTPEYASPEQLFGQKVSTASDIYSLGVIFYKLLTVHHPFERFVSDTESLRRFINERLFSEMEAERPSTFVLRQISTVKNADFQLDERKIKDRKRTAKSLQGDLDNIALKAMHRQSERRYASVQQFAEDIRRHQRGLPVIARPDTLRYRFVKFVNRNRLFVSSLTIFLLALLLASAVTARQARIADSQRQLAERRFNEQREVLKSFIFKYHDAVESLPGATGVREMLVKDATQYLDRLARDAEDDKQLKRELAQAFLKVGDVQGNTFAANLGDTASALQNYRKGVSLLEEVAAKEQANDLKAELRDAYQKLGRLLLRTGELTESLELQTKSLQISQEFAAQAPLDLDLQRRLTRSHYHLGDVKLKSYEFPAACDLYRQAITTIEQTFERDKSNLETRKVRSSSKQRLGLCLERTVMNSPDLSAAEANNLLLEAEKSYQAAEEEAAFAVEKEPLNIFAQRTLAVSLMTSGSVKGRLNKFEEAAQRLDKAEQIFLSIAKDNANSEVRYDLAVVKDFRGDIENARDNPAACLKFYGETLDELEKLSALDQLNGDVREAIYNLHIKIGDRHYSDKNYVQALKSYRKVRLLQTEFWTQKISSPAFKSKFAEVLNKEEISLTKLAGQ